MRLKRDGASLVLVLVTVATATSVAQQNREPSAATYHSTSKSNHQQERPLVPRILTADEGLAVLGAALESRAHLDFKSDCSHLVHAIYERAGLPYTYVSSSDLYAGIDEFRRVTRPQPGDLVVWPGHVGIAVNPAQGSFFSSLRSGLGVDSYESAYWRQRGLPRFFRYVKDRAPIVPIAVANRPTSLKPAALANAESRALGPRKAGEEAETWPDSSPASADTDPTKMIIPHIHLVNSERPKAEEVKDALEQTFSEAEDALRDRNVLRLAHPLIVFDQLAVERVRLKRDQGWAEVRINGAFSISREKAKTKKHAERQHWLLVRRDHGNWELTLPGEAIYLPHEIAVRMLAHQLAALTEDTSGALRSGEDKAELARLLSTLLQE